MKKITAYFIGVAIVIIAIFDIYVFTQGGSDATISQALISWSYKYPISAFIAGVICGHLYWQMPKIKSKD